MKQSEIPSPTLRSPTLEEDAAENDDYRPMIRQQLAAVAEWAADDDARRRNVALPREVQK